MAIGLGKMFGFHFEENFRYPYIASSVSEFWRRWHISLQTWFRDYVYFPLGGSRVKTVSRLLFNLFAVWLLTGIWHGASWNFIIWGLLYFVLLAIEKLTGLDRKLGRFGHVYTLFFVMIGWLIFRAETLSDAGVLIRAMFGAAGQGGIDAGAVEYLKQNAVYYLAAVMCSTPIFSVLDQNMPPTIYRSSEITRCDKLYDYLTANTDLEIVYPKLELFAAKNICPVFYKYDTHWNRIGAFVGVQSILQQLYGSCQDVAKVEIITENTNTSGDLAAMINMTDKYNNDSFYSVASDSYDPALQVPEDLLIIGDSFSTLMMDDLKYYFEDARQVGVWTFKKSMLDEYQPDVII